MYKENLSKCEEYRCQFQDEYSYLFIGEEEKIDGIYVCYEDDSSDNPKNTAISMENYNNLDIQSREKYSRRHYCSFHSPIVGEVFQNGKLYNKDSINQDIVKVMEYIKRKYWDKNEQDPKHVFVNLSGVVFAHDFILSDHYEEKYDISFVNCIFIQDAVFNNINFKYYADFTNVIFNKNAYFKGVIFNKNAYFNRVNFKFCADFTESKFCDHAYFSDTKFHNNALFVLTDFTTQALFDNAQFLWNVSFNKSNFRGRANFINSYFKWNTYFERVNFIDMADFSCARFDNKTSFLSANFSKTADFSSKEQSNFALINFSGCNFFTKSNNSYISFLNRNFSEGANFINANFFKAPKFFNCTASKKLNFAKAKFHDTKSKYARNAYRELLFISKGSARDNKIFKNLEKESRKSVIEIFSSLYNLNTRGKLKFIKKYVSKFFRQ